MSNWGLLKTGRQRFRFLLSKHQSYTANVIVEKQNIIDLDKSTIHFTLYRRRQSSYDEIGYVNEGMMVENPLYQSKRNMRAVPCNQVLPVAHVITTSDSPV